MDANMVVCADEIREGDFIPGLDNAYVVDIEETVYLSYGSRYPTDIGYGKMMLTCHDANGDEQYILLNAENPVSIYRDALGSI